MPEQTVKCALAGAARRLRDAGIDAPAHEARLLAAHVLGTDQASLLRDCDRPMRTDRFDALVARRLAREPMAHLLGHTGFWTLTLAVSPATLIPRPDSESLIEAALAARPDRMSVQTVLDLGTGTGCLVLAALTEFPAAHGIGVDRSLDACRLAAANAAANGLAQRAAMVCGDWAAAIAGGFDLVLANPPYIRTAELPALMPDVGRYEPAVALDGGADGLAAYRSIMAVLPRLLAPDGLAILELGAGQGPLVSDLARQAGFTTATRRDLGGHERALTLLPVP